MFKEEGNRGFSVTREDAKRDKKRGNSKNREMKTLRHVPGLSFFCRQSNHFWLPASPRCTKDLNPRGSLWTSVNVKAQMCSEICKALFQGVFSVESSPTALAQRS